MVYGLGLLLLAVYALAPIQFGIVLGNSMAPTLKHGEAYWLDRTYYQDHPVRRGDVVVFRKNGKTWMKRVVGAPGDSLYLLRAESQVQDDLIMDYQLERLRSVRYRPWHVQHEVVELRVPAGCCYVVGDNLEASEDSRRFGVIRNRDIVGRPAHRTPQPGELRHVAGRYVPQTAAGT